MSNRKSRKASKKKEQLEDRSSELEPLEATTDHKSGKRGSKNASSWKQAIVQEMEQLAFRLGQNEAQIDRLKSENRAALDRANLIIDQLRLEYADALKELGRTSQATELYGEVTKSRPKDSKPFEKLAEALIVDRKFKEAIRILERLADLKPDDLKVHELLCAVYAELGQIEKGRNILRRFLFRRPIRVAKIGSSEFPAILRVSGLDGAYCKLTWKRNGRPGRYYRGGHFLTRHLVRSGRYNTYYWTIANDNINKVEEIPEHGLVLNTIAEPDAEQASLISLCAFLDRHPETPVINHPSLVLKTTRDLNYKRLKNIKGVVFPKTIRLDTAHLDGDQMAEVLDGEGFTYPIIVRETGTHTAASTEKVENRDELNEYLENSTARELYAIQFLDIRYDEVHYNKKRVFMIDGRIFPVVSHFDTVWNVHGFNRLKVMKRNEWMMEHEKQFLEDPKKSIGTKNYNLIKKICQMYKLDFMGMDFFIQKDGSMLIYELNPSMRHSFKHAKNFQYMDPYMKKISAAFDLMVRRKLIG